MPLNDVPGRPVISNCGTPTEKISEFLFHHLQPIIKAGKSYIKDTIDFLEKLKNLGNIPSNAILVTAHVVSQYLSIPHEAGLHTLYEKLEERTDKKILPTNLVEMFEFIWKINFFEFETKTIQQVSGTAIGTKFHHHMRVYLWSEQKTTFLTQKLLSHGCG